MLDERGQTIPIAVIAILVGGIGAPVAVDTVDVDPDHPLYSLERFGESIKGFFAPDEAMFSHNRCEERLGEWKRMCDKGMGERYRSLMDEYRDHIDNFPRLTRADIFEMIMAMLEARLEMLEELKEKYPEHATCINMAIEHIKRVKEMLKSGFPAEWREFEPREDEFIKRRCEEYEWHPEEWEPCMPEEWKAWWPRENYPWRRPLRWSY